MAYLWVKHALTDISIMSCAFVEIRETMVSLFALLIYEMNFASCRKFWFVLPLGNVTAEQQQIEIPSRLARQADET